MSKIKQPEESIKCERKKTAIKNKTVRSSPPFLRKNILIARTVWHSRLIAISLISTAITYALAGYLLFIHNDFQPEVRYSDRIKNLRFEPEYNRKLHRVVVALAKRDTTLKLQHEILAALPDYTRILLLLPEDNLGLIQSELEDKIYCDRIEFITYDAISLNNSRLWLLFREKRKLIEVDISDSDTEVYSGSVWAQDLFEVATGPSGRTLLVQPCVQKWYSIAGTESYVKITPDNIFVQCLSKAGLETLTVPLAFLGGNTLIDETADGRRIAFCGGDMLATTRTVWTALKDRHLTDENITADLKLALNVDQVVMLSPERIQPYLMYHLDQAMLLLQNKIVAIPRLVGTPPEEPTEAEEIKDVKRFLAELRTIMLELGYRLVDIETSVQNVLHCQHYVNAIPYIDAETGKKTVLMPVFRSAQKDSDKDLINKNTATLESLGYEVVHIPTFADELRGGIHCLVNVIE